jgi:hypothetical protein
VATGKEKAGTSPTPGLDKVTGTPVFSWMNINNISTVLRNNGTADINPSQTNSGLTYPKGSGKTAIFESGLLWAARIAGDPQVRVGGSAYSSGLQPGKLITPGVSEDPNLPKNRVYRVRPDYKTGDMSSEMTDEGKASADVRAAYERDWTEWPATDGAPYVDVDSNGSYNPNVDIPGVKGASQTLWFVANDDNPTNVANLYGSQPLGVECQVTVWAYAQEGALNNMLFKSYLLINKSAQRFDSMYVCQWSDPDLGFATDDYVGCDTSLSLGYVYNANNRDQQYGSLPPPAAGFDFFQGPRVSSPGGTAIYRGKRISGYRNLPMTAFFYFINTSPTLADPTRADPSGAVQFYNYMRGRVGLTGQFFQDPQGNPTTFTLTGDPVAGTGWIDGQQFNADDRRMGLASGPFTMAPGDTQEIVVAEIAAGAQPGVDRLTAVSLLKFYDKVAQLTYDNLFSVPAPPASPRVAISELDRTVVMSWGDDQASVRATEGPGASGFQFQGYNVYQLPSASASLSAAKKIAVFDIPDGVTRISDQVFDPTLGVISSKVVQLGTDSGIRRYLRVTGDVFNGGNPLINGIKYYFAVTAYSYTPDPNSIPNNLESSAQIITVIPRSTGPGSRLMVGYGDTIIAANTGTGPFGDGRVLAQVVDPARLTGHQYRVEYAGTGAATTWSLVDATTSQVKLTGQTNQTGDDTSPIVDGMIVRVFGAPDDFKTFLVTSNAAGAVNPPEPAAFGFNGSGFPLGPPLAAGTDRPDGTRQQSAGLAAAQGWGIHTGMNDPAMDYHYDFFISRLTQGGARWPSIVPNDFELRFTAAGGKALFPSTFTGGTDSLVDVPFELWNIGVNTPDNPADDYRMFPNVLDVDGNYRFNLLSKAGTDTVDNGGGGPTHGISGGNNDPFTDWIYWVNPVDRTPGQAGYNAIVAQVKADIAAANDPYLGAGTSGDVLRRMVLIGWNFGAVTNPSGYARQMPEPGTIFRIVSTKPSRAGKDAFTYTAPAPTYSKDLAKNDVSKINVFPNPYYGVNTEEINKYNRFVTFTHLPQEAIIRIFNLAGVQVREIRKNSPGQFERWDLANESGLPVGSGLYIAHIEMPGLDGAVKILKVAVVQEQQILDRF